MSRPNEQLQKQHRGELPYASIFYSICVLLVLLVGVSACAQPKKNNQPPSAYTHKTPDPDGIGKQYLGREIAFVMGTAGADWLERNNRNAEENTDSAIAMLPLQPNSVVADIGAGTGYYTFRMAKKLPLGKVYAVEVQDDFINYLNNQKKQSGTKNVEVVKGAERSPNLPDTSIDLAIMVDVYHELEYPKEMLQAIRKALRPKGKLLLLEYRAEDPTIAIKELHKMSVQQANKELEANGFKLAQRLEFLPIQHYLLYEKN